MLLEQSGRGINLEDKKEDGKEDEDEDLLFYEEEEAKKTRVEVRKSNSL